MLKHNIYFISFLIIASMFLIGLPFDIYARDVYCTNSLKNNLWFGSYFNQDIKRVQTYLAHKGFNVPTTGNYLTKTVDAVKNFQISLGMEPTGQVGSMTRLAINQEICKDTIEDFNPKKNETKPDVADFKEVVFLDIPLIEQKYRLSCEAASMQMALLFKGVVKSQDQLLNDIGISKPFQKYYKNGVLIWGDPDEAFVGDVKGFVYRSPSGYLGATGWGVNNGPVANVLKSILPNTEEIDNATMDNIKNELQKNNPIIFWHKSDLSAPELIKYKTLNKKDILFTATHVAVITGFAIDKNNKVSYFINDPVTGRLTIDEESLIRYMSRWHNDIVVVR